MIVKYAAWLTGVSVVVSTGAEVAGAVVVVDGERVVATVVEEVVATGVAADVAGMSVVEEASDVSTVESVASVGTVEVSTGSVPSVSASVGCASETSDSEREAEEDETNVASGAVPFAALQAEQVTSRHRLSSSQKKRVRFID